MLRRSSLYFHVIVHILLFVVCIHIFCRMTDLEDIVEGMLFRYFISFLAKRVYFPWIIYYINIYGALLMNKFASTLCTLTWKYDEVVILLCGTECILSLPQNFFRYAGVVGILALSWHLRVSWIGIEREGYDNRSDYLSEHRLTNIHCQHIVLALEIAEGQLEAHRGRCFELKLPRLWLEFTHYRFTRHWAEDFTFW